MNSLKSAFGKEGKASQKISSDISSSIKKFSRSKSQSMWALDMEQKEVQVSLDTDQKLDLLNNLIRKSYQKDSHLSQIVFQRLVQDFQDSLGNSSSTKSQISYYLVLEDKLTDLIDLYQKSNPSLCDYIEDFHQKIQTRIASLRNKQKQTDLNDFNKLVDKKFKKKPDYLDVGGIKLDVRMKSKEKEKSKQPKKNSNEKKLSRLFSKEKAFKTNSQLKKDQQHDDYLLSETMIDRNEGISFSSVMSTSVAVKQRRTRKKSNHYANEDFMTKNAHKKPQQSAQNQQDGQKTDKAFIFYRPKKGTKK